MVESPMSRAQLAPSRIQGEPCTSPTKPPLKISYSLAVKTGITPRARDPGKQHVTQSHDPSRDHPASKISRDISACNPGKISGDLPRDWSPTRSLDRVSHRYATRPLITTCKTVRTINEGTRINRVTRPTAAQSAVRRTPVAQSAARRIPRTDQQVTYRIAGPKVGPPVTRTNTYPKPSPQTTLY
jgi:hypothetical protein